MQTTLGSISTGTIRTEDLLLTFANVLEDLDIANEHTALILEAFAATLNPESEAAGWTLDELFDALDEFAPPGAYFGAHPGDGADFGFWPVED